MMLISLALAISIGLLAADVAMKMYDLVRG